MICISSWDFIVIQQIITVRQHEMYRLHWTQINQKCQSSWQSKRKWKREREVNLNYRRMLRMTVMVAFKVSRRKLTVWMWWWLWLMMADALTYPHFILQFALAHQPWKFMKLHCMAPQREFNVISFAHIWDYVACKCILIAHDDDVCVGVGSYIKNVECVWMPVECLCDWCQYE